MYEPSPGPSFSRYQPPALETVSPADLNRVADLIGRLGRAVGSRVVGQAQLQHTLLAALLANGHVLLESVPGLAKTTAAATLAAALGATFHRIQCTPDLLPADVIGTQVYDPTTGRFHTQLGPVHANVVLLDEINRASAKTQSAMLEAMQERQTSIGGVVYPLPRPFLVLATQNPIEQEGTYELPEAQLDRFLVKATLTYPNPDEEVDILDRIDHGVYQRTDDLATGVTPEDLAWAQDLTQRVYVDQVIKKYIVRLVQTTRRAAGIIDPQLAGYIQYGASPRAAIAFMALARAHALLSGRSFTIPEDVKMWRHEVLRHRLILSFEALADAVRPEAIIDAIVQATPTP
ncbi:MAG: MoxR family ATPase [Propionibacteriaceae bacterium]|jgi:MoxR-like ATPase|nr:MoxR family ATPase [Propionibacteriaceae bacterium]